MTSPSRSRLLRSILEAIGAAGACTLSLLSPACGGQAEVPAAESGAGGGGASSSSSGGTVDCEPALKSRTQDLPAGTCGADASSYGKNLNCFAPPAAPATCAGSFTDECVLSTYSCGLNQRGDSIACGPFEGPDGACCYVLLGDCAVGRPFTVHGRERLAELVPGGGWGEPLAPDLHGLDEETRAALADAWGREALFEHASIASFARFTLELLALGARADLVVSAQRALADEHRHARVSFGLAEAYAGAPRRPGPIAIDGALDASSDPVAIAEGLAREGCVAETIAALQAARASDGASDPVVKAALARIAEDEAEHAALAWRALAWMLEVGGSEVRAAALRVFADPGAHVSLGAVTPRAGDASAMRAHGYLPVEERRTLAREALGQVIGPAALALFGARTSARSASKTLEGAQAEGAGLVS